MVHSKKNLDSKRNANGNTSAHATISALKHRSPVCCIGRQTVNAINVHTNFNGVLQCSMSIKDNEAFHIYLYLLFGFIIPHVKILDSDWSRAMD